MRKIIITIFTISLFVSCKQEQKWISVFDGKTFNGWHQYNKGDITNYWNVEDGAMVFGGRTENPSYNIVTDKEYTNFKLSLEWKISEGGNSGIMWGVQEGEKLGEPYLTGPEIQVLDNEKHPDGKLPSHHAGALYDMIAPPNNVAKPVGEWNLCEILINHKTNEGKVWLNGILTAEFPVHGEKWDALVANSKFKDWGDFGKFQTGKISLQDHGDKVSYKNIKIQEL